MAMVRGLDAAESSCGGFQKFCSREFGQKVDLTGKNRFTRKCRQRELDLCAKQTETSMAFRTINQQIVMS